jgi:PTH1 family peptidyl-tRNA hydrolase
MKLIVGLGNPGPKYALTRHNVGFMAVDYLIEKWGAGKVGSKFKGELFKSGEYLLLKPLTFMNLSGESVELVKNFYKLDNSQIIVIHDDIDLQPGQLKFKRGGSAGGHNGLKSIDAHIGKDYWRVRIGVGRPLRKGEVVSYVLGNFDPKELEECILPLFPVIEKAVQEIEKAPSKYSRKGCQSNPKPQSQLEGKSSAQGGGR